MATFDHPFLPNASAPIRKMMLEAIGVATIDELYSDIPSQVRTNRALKVDWLPSEQEVKNHVDRVLAENKSANDMPVFLGRYLQPLSSRRGQGYPLTDRIPDLLHT